MQERSLRIAWIDVAKALTILLVVFGHTLRDGISLNVVYSFHVATFFLLSGMTCKADNLKARIKNDFLRIMVPYYCFGVISIMIFAILGKFVANSFEMDVNTSVSSNLLGLLYACPQNNGLKFNMPLWFLPSLFATKMIYYALYRLCRGKQVYVLLSSVGLTAAGFVYTRLNGPGLPFNLAVSLKMLVFFSLGRIAFLSASRWETIFSKGIKTIAVGFVVLVITGTLACVFPIVDYATDDFPNAFAFLVTAILGSFGVCLVSIGIGECRALEHVGKSTLAILAMHKFPVLVVQTVGPLKNLFASGDSAAAVCFGILISIVTIVLCVAVEWVIRRFFPFFLGDFSKYSRCQ